MVTNCDYFSLYDSEEGLTDWAKTLLNNYKNEVDRSRRKELEYETNSEIFERLGIDGENLPRRKLTKAEETRKSAGLPVTCPHEPVAEGKCIFHLSPKKYNKHGITKKEVRSEFLKEFRNAEDTEGEVMEDITKEAKCFAGGKFKQLDLSYLTLASDSNRPTQLRYAYIEELNLDNSVIDEGLRLDGSEIHSISCKDAHFRRIVSFRGSTLDCGVVSFSDSVFDDKVLFKDADILTNGIQFEGCTFRSKLDLSSIEVNLSQSDENGGQSGSEIQFKQNSVAGDFDCSGLKMSASSLNKVGIDFLECHFGGSVDFSECEVPKNESTSAFEVDDTDTDVDWEMKFNNSEFEGGTEMGEFDIQGDLKMIDTYFDDSSTFEKADVEGDLNLENAEFSGGNITFDDMDVEGDLNLENAEFSGGDITFDTIEVKGSINCRGVVFGRGNISFRRGANIEGDANFRQISFSGERANFSDFVVGGRINFEGSVLDASGGKIDFGGMVVGGGVNFRQATLTGNEISFKSTEMCSDMDKNQSEKLREDWEAEADAIFSSTVWEGGDIYFSGTEVGGDIDISLAVFYGQKAEFGGMDLDGSLRVTNAEFNTTTTDFSGIEVESDTVSFQMSVFNSTVSFNEAKLKQVGKIDFSRIDGESAVLSFCGVETGGTRVEFSNAVVTDGEFEIGGHDTVYDFSDATVGEIQIGLGENGGGKLFEHFIFLNTDFNGFDFSDDDVVDELKRTGWEIHTTHTGGGRIVDIGDNSEGFLKRYYRLATQGPKVVAENENRISPDELETTYMRAKLGADRNGDPDAVSHFFQKELQYRRKSHGYRFWQRFSQEKGEDEKDDKDVEDSLIRIAWSWVANTTLGLTVGYGERPSNVVLTSVFVVFIFSFIYQGISALPSGSGYLSYLTYSFQGFVQLLFGIEPTGDVMVRLFTAIQGFIGAFVIALFVITLTRSINR
jgi:hypothetical protein